MRNNTYWAIFGNILNVVLLGLFTLLSARLLGPESLGVFSFWLGVVTIVAKLNETFSQSIIYRHLSKDLNDKTFLIIGIQGRFIISIILIIIGVILVITGIMNYWFLLLFFLPLLSYRLDGIRSLFETPFKANLSIRNVIVSQLIDNVLLLLLVSVQYFLQYTNLIVFISVYVLCSFPGLVYLSLNLMDEISYKFNPELFFGNLKKMVIESRPILFYGLLSVILSNLDYLILKFLSNAHETGILSSALRMTIPFMVIPGIITSSLFPYMVKKVGSEDLTNFTKIMSSLLTYIPLVFTGLWLIDSKYFIQFLFGSDYLRGAFLPAYLFTYLTYSFLNFFCVDLLIAHGKYKIIMQSALMILLINMVAGVWFYRLFGLEGLMVAKIISAIFGFIVVITALPTRQVMISSHLKTISIVFLSFLTLQGLTKVFFISTLFQIITVLLVLTLFTALFSSDIRLLFKIVLKAKNG